MHGAPGTNRLLQLFGEDARERLGPLVPMHLAARDVLLEPGAPTLQVYFPITAVISLVATMEGGESAEVAVVGREGMVGLFGVIGTVDPATSAVVQVPGTAVRLPAATLRAARVESASVRNTLDLYTHARLIQVAQTAACGRLHLLEARLARWLLAVHDRIDSDELLVSHESIAHALGVRRPAVSTAMQHLQRLGAIVRRGRRTIIASRARLETLACECHRVLNREFERLLSAGGAPEAPAARRQERRSAPPDTQNTAALEALREISGRLLLVSLREQEAREAAEAANRAKDQFLATLSHELRTPLHAILGWCHMLLGKPGAPVQRGLEVIERNARAQLKLIEDLLDAARVTAETLTIQHARVDLPGLVTDVVDAIGPSALEKNVAVHLTVRDEVPPLVGDADRLQQVLLNIVANSVKFTDPGGSVDVQVASEAGRARVVVQDSGRGIDKVLLPHVFERFRQGSAAEGAQKGLGLGLTIARALVELHGGTIAVESPGENQGTTCTIELPVGSPDGEATSLRRAQSARR